MLLFGLETPPLGRNYFENVSNFKIRISLLYILPSLKIINAF